MVRLKFLILVLCCAFSFALFAQSNNDCVNFVYVCGDTLFPISSNGPGNVIEIPHPDSVGGTSKSNPTGADSPTKNKGCLLTGETYSTWLMFPIKTSGTLEFHFATDDSPNPQKGFYDWTLFDMTNNTCEDIIMDRVSPVRCNWNDSKSGGTGIADTSNLPVGAEPGNFEPLLQVTAGDRFVICFNNFNSVNAIVPMVFAGTSELGISEITQVDVRGDNDICKGAKTVLTAFNALNGSQYFWNDGQTGLSITVSPSDTSIYSVEAKLLNCENIVTMDSITIFVSNSLTSDFELDAPSACQGENIRITYLGTGSDTANLVWDVGDGAIVSSTKKSIEVTWQEKGDKNVVLFVGEGNCRSDTSTKSINIKLKPEAAFSTIPSYGTIDDPEVRFINESVNVNGDVIWDFGDGGDIDYAESPIHSYPGKGSFLVQLVVYNGFSCSDTTYQIFEVKPEMRLFTPNAFTPNADNLNDLFGATGVGILEYTMRVFNLWGVMLFESTDINVKWDGRYNGDYVPNGMYVYQYVVKDYADEERVIIDHFMVVK